MAICAVALTAAAHDAAAQAADIRPYSIPAKPLSAALVDFAVQSGISIGAEEARRCRLTGNAVVGRFSVRQGLDRLLAGTGCTYRMLDAQTVRIVRTRSNVL